MSRSPNSFAEGVPRLMSSTLDTYFGGFTLAETPVVETEIEPPDWEMTMSVIRPNAKAAPIAKVWLALLMSERPWR